MKKGYLGYRRILECRPDGRVKLKSDLPDHLNTPRLVANATGTTVWKWDQQEPFGVNVPDENPSALGQFEFPLRFPGQYADKETNLYYNYFRDYDPHLGRYPQSDPLGLQDGINTYSYVGGNPLTKTDRLGLLVGPAWSFNLCVAACPVWAAGFCATGYQQTPCMLCWAFMALRLPQVGNACLTACTNITSNPVSCIGFYTSVCVVGCGMVNMYLSCTR